MALDEVLALVRDLSCPGAAVTLIGSPTRDPEGSNSDHSKTSLLEHCDSRDPTREKPNDDASISQDRDHKKQKYSSMSAEVCPTRDRKVLQKKLGKKIDVRYLNEIRSFKDRIKYSLVNVTESCNQQHCPVIKERLNQHQLQHHTKKMDYSCGTRMRLRDQAINVSPTLSRMRLPKFTLPLTEEGRTVQTEITMTDFNSNRFTPPKPVSKITSDFTSGDIPLRKTETREVLPKKDFYKEHLQNEILNWLHHVPMFYSLNFTTKDIKENIVNNLAEKINTLAVEAHDKNYEIKTKIEIENCLSRLPMWLHGSKQDQILFKEGLREKLWNKIQGLNENFLGIKYEKAVGHEKEVKDVKSNESYEKEVIEWSSRLELDPDQTIKKEKVVELIMKRLSPLLKIPLHTTSYKLILKGEIIDILDDLPISLTCQRYKTVHLNRFAEELANRLLSIQIKRESSGHKISKEEAPGCNQFVSQVLGLPMPKSICNIKELITNRVGECLDKVPVCHRNDLKSEICLTFLDSANRLRTGDDISIKDEISQFLRDTGKLSEDKTQNVAKMIIRQVKDALKEARNSATTSFDSVMPQLSGTISVYRWGSEQPTATSTPKKASKKEIPKLSAEERSYMDNVANVIRRWMDTLPKQFDEDTEFKETAIYDLAGDIMDHLKMEQLAPETFTDKDKYQNYIMYRWLYKFDIFDDTNIKEEAKPYIRAFLTQLKQVPVPKLTLSQHGTRQAMEYIKHMEGERGWEEDYVPKGIDVLQDQISVWMNEQPTEIYSSMDKCRQYRLIHELALNLQDRLRNKNPENEIHNDIKQWLDKVVAPTEKEHIGLLSEDLKERIIHTPQDRTLEARHEQRKRDLAAKLAAKRQMRLGIPSTVPEQQVSNIGNIEGDPDKTIREFIGKYIEHYYDIDDPMARGAFAHLLKTELRKLGPVTRKEVYENFEQQKSHERFRADKLNDELEYIKIISDWLKTIPIEASYNTPGNKDRIEFINDLAKNMQEIDEQRKENPDAMEYNYLMASMILQSMHTYGLPILPEHKDNTPLMVEQLMQKLVGRIPKTPNSYAYANQPQSGDQFSQSLNASDIKEQDLNEFIKDYIRINGRDIADDETKLEAYTARLMKEIQKMVEAGIDPRTLTKAQVYEKFARVSIPTEDAVKRYCLEIHYVKEITDWMRNIPLIPYHKQPHLEEEIIKMISDLSEKMCDTDAYRTEHPNDRYADKLLEQYIAAWISRLPLNKTKVINIPILTQQLMNRLDRNKTDPFLSGPKPLQEPKMIISKSVNATEDEIMNYTTKDQRQRKSFAKDVSSESMPSRGRSLELKNPLDYLKRSKTPAETIVEAIENWSNKLPIKGGNKEEIEAMKEGIARRLFQKTGELNVDPLIFNDDLLYREMLGDEIDTQLENVPQNPELQAKREMLKEGLIKTIMETNKIMKQNSAGDSYRHKLETTIDASIPNPVQSMQTYDPGFEMYKNHLADMFILENFDHANDDVKASYEKRIRHEIDKHFVSARNKNALPLTKDEIYNEIYSALFKVPMPSQISVIDEIEQIKTRCIIDGWYEELPVQHTDDINELLERDKNLSTLAKKIHELEKKNCKDDLIHKEIVKALEKFPLSPDNLGTSVYAYQLQAALKSSASSRKYVPPDPRVGKGKSIKKEKKISRDGNVSRIPGPSVTLQSKSTTAKPCLLVSPMVHKKPGDIIVEVVEEWCNQLPLLSSEENNKVIRDNISTRIIIQISELNMDPEIFNDDVVYDELLDEELDNVLSNLPVDSDFAKSNPARKKQLKDVIKSIKPLIKEEKAKHDYKEELYNTVTNILRAPHDSSADKTELFIKLKDEIVENFVQYNYNKNDEESRIYFKKEVHDAVIKYCTDVRDKDTGDELCMVDPLVRRNQLLCELEKIPVPREALKDEVAEIKMRAEVEEFLREQCIPEGKAETTMKKHLAKRLCDIEKSGYTPANEKKMKADITRCLQKLNTEVSPETVDDFVNKLKNNETVRKMPPITYSQAEHLNRYPGAPVSAAATSGPVYGSPSQGILQQRTFQTPQQRNESTNSDGARTEEQWQSLPETQYNMPDSSYQTPYSKDYTRENQQWSSQAGHPVDQSFGQSNVTYEDFEAGNLLSSSVAPKGPGRSKTSGPVDQSLGQSNVTYEDFEGGNLLSSSVAPKGPGRSKTSGPVDQSLGQSNVTYEDFEGGNLLSSSVAPQGPGHPKSSGKSILNSSASPGRPKGFPNQKSIGGYQQAQVPRSGLREIISGQTLSRADYDQNSYQQAQGPRSGLRGVPSGQTLSRLTSDQNSYQQAQGPRSGLREVTSGQTLSRPSFGQIATPRQVAQSPVTPQTPSQQHSTSQGDDTPDSFFRAPVFKPTPLGRPLPIPIIEPVRLPTSAPSMHPRRSQASPEDAVIPPPPCFPMKVGGRPMFDRRPRGFESTEDEEMCVCERCTKRHFRRLPFCMLAMEHYLEDCFGFPMWCSMRFPEFLYY